MRSNKLKSEDFRNYRIRGPNVKFALIPEELIFFWPKSTVATLQLHSKTIMLASQSFTSYAVVHLSSLDDWPSKKWSCCQLHQPRIPSQFMKYTNCLFCTVRFKYMQSIRTGHLYPLTIKRRSRRWQRRTFPFEGVTHVVILRIFLIYCLRQNCPKKFIRCLRLGLVSKMVSSANKIDLQIDPEIKSRNLISALFSFVTTKVHTRQYKSSWLVICQKIRQRKCTFHTCCPPHTVPQPCES